MEVVDVSAEEVLRSRKEEIMRDKEISLFFMDPMNIPSVSYTNQNELMEASNFFGENVMESKLGRSVGILQIADGEWYSVNMTARRQSNGYYCGPAAVLQNLTFHKGSTSGLPSQTTLANLAGTTSAGSSSYGLRDALNNYSSKYKFSKYVVGNVTTSQQTTWESRIKNNLITARRAPILLYETGNLPRYKNKNLRHYNSVRSWSYDYISKTKKIRNVDPHYSDTYFGTHWDPVGSKSAKGAFLATAKAYRNGGNPNMIY